MKLFISNFLLIFSFALQSQTPEGVKWLSHDQAEKLAEQTGKPIIILEENHDTVTYFYNLINKNKDYINEFYLPVKIKVSAEKDKVKIISSQISLAVAGYMSESGFKTMLETNANNLF